MGKQKDVVVDEVEVVEQEFVAEDYLMWVGATHYPTADIYIEEALTRGPCKRMGKLPNGLVPGESRIFLAHDDGLVGDGFIFGYFVPTELQFVANKEEDVPAAIFDRVSFLSLKEIKDEEERECGYRQEGLYVVASNPDNEGELVIFDKPRDLNKFDEGRPHFRGLLRIEYGDKVVSTKRGKFFKRCKKADEIDATTPWTEEEDMDLMVHMSNGSTKSRAAQELAYKTGRKKSAILYRFKTLAAKMEQNETGS